ncbi:MAG: dihydrolipoamide acetyltransferase family protein [Thermaerobacter sp.]|nr:dihydrolipoamide acetyltransferase family protein [Thermaerobacter sp.]
MLEGEQKDPAQADRGAVGPIRSYQWILPDVGEGIHEAEIVRWLVGPGDWVGLDQPIADIQTDKSVMEIPSPVAGQVARLFAQEGQLVRIGTVLVEFAVAAPNPAGDAPNGLPPGQSPHQANLAPSSERRVLATPAVRRLARELGVNLQQVTPGGEGGRVRAEDVRRHANAPQPTDDHPVEPVEPVELVEPTAPLASSPGRMDRVPFRGTRRAIADHMVKAKFTAPHVTTMDEVDVARLVALRESLRPEAERRGVRLTYLPFVLKAAVTALREYPYLNASLDDERAEIVLKREYHIGIAVDDPTGLVVPVLRDVDQKSILQLSVELAALTEKAHARTLSVPESHGSTFTVTNFGSLGGRFATPIINYPEVAILGTGRIEQRPIVLADGSLAARPVMGVVLTFDHRVIDGGLAARFLNRVMGLLGYPERLLLEML